MRKTMSYNKVLSANHISYVMDYHVWVIGVIAL